MEIEMKMDSPSNFASKCWLCSEPARSKGRWSEVLDEKVAESICQLLSLDTASYLEFFKAAAYCDPCQETVLEIDTLIRTLKSLKAKILQYRTKLSGAFLVNLNISPLEDAIDPIEDGEEDPIVQPGDEIQENERPVSPVPTSPPSPVEIHTDLKIKSEPEKHLSPTVIHAKHEPSELQSPSPTATANANSSGVNSTSTQLDSPKQILEPVPNIQESEDLLPEPEVASEASAESFPTETEVQTRRITRSSFRKPTISYRELVNESESEAESQSQSRNEDSDFVADLSDADVVPDGTESVASASQINLTVSSGGDPRRHPEPDGRTESSTTAAGVDTISGDKADNATLNAEATSKLRSRRPPKSRRTAKSDSALSEATILKTSRKRKAAQVSETEVSSEDDTDEEESGGGSMRTGHRNRTPNGRGSDWRLKTDKLTIEVSTTQRDGKYHCYHGECTKSSPRLRDVKKHISNVHPEALLQEERSENIFRCRALSCSFTSDSILGLYDHFKEIHKSNQVVSKLALLTEKQQKRRNGRVHCFHDNCSKSYLFLRDLRSHIFKLHTQVQLLKTDRKRKQPALDTEPVLVPSERAPILRSTRKRNTLQKEVVEASSEETEKPTDPGDVSNKKQRKVKTRKRSEKSAGQPVPLYLSILKDHLGLEIKTTYRNFRYHCFSQHCAHKSRHIYETKKHISAEHAELVPEQNSEPKFYRCRAVDCSFSIESAMELYNHFKEVHETSPIARKQVTLTKEQREPKEDGRVHCFHGNCSKSYLRPKELKRHIYKCHTERTHEEDAKINRFPCREPGCSFVNRSTFALQVHMYKVHQNDPLPYKCAPCKKNYSTHDPLIKHNNAHHRPKEFVCHLCGKRNARKSDLNVHMRKCHKNEEGFKCSVCFRNFFFKETCEKHEAKHVPGGPLTCIINNCIQSDRVFENQEALRLHVECHNEAQAQEVFCEKCGTSFTNRHGLTLHLKTHTDLFEFPCTDCDKKFRSKHLQESHFETVHGVNGGQVYPCKLCEKTFHCRMYLYKHNAWHKHGVNANKPLKLQKKVMESSEEEEEEEDS